MNKVTQTQIIVIFNLAPSYSIEIRYPRPFIRLVIQPAIIYDKTGEYLGIALWAFWTDDNVMLPDFTNKTISCESVLRTFSRRKIQKQNITFKNLLSRINYRNTTPYAIIQSLYNIFLQLGRHELQRYDCLGSNRKQKINRKKTKSII